MQNEYDLEKIYKDTELNTEEAEDDKSFFNAEIADSLEDSVHLYLQEISITPLLTAEDEVKLGRAIMEGKTAEAKLKTTESMTEAEIKLLQQLAQQGKTAKDSFAQANLRLVVNIAKHFTGRGIAFLDLIQEGNMGLMYCLERWDFTAGYKFSTYATWWIRQAILRAIADKARIIRIPVHMGESINKYRNEKINLTMQLGREPKPEEIADAMHISTKKLRLIECYMWHAISLEMTINEDEDSMLVDKISNDNALNPEEIAEKNILKEQLALALSMLAPREAQVISLRFGLDDGEEKTLDTIGKILGVTKERVRQIEEKALKRLRKPVRSRYLYDFTNREI